MQNLIIINFFFKKLELVINILLKTKMLFNYFSDLKRNNFKEYQILMKKLAF